MPTDEESGPRRRRRRALVIAVALLTTLTLVLGGGAMWYFQRLQSSISELRRDDLMPTRAPTGADPTVVAGPQPLNIVLLGSDTYGNERGRSDVLMVAHIPAKRDKVYLMSFPRDMWVDIPGHGMGKINWAYSFGGPPLTVQTLDNLLGLPMDHAAVIEFEGFIRLTDVLGGVEVFNSRTFRSSHLPGHVYPEGMLTLRGEEALAYVRERYNLPNGDLDRAANQRDVLQAIIDKLARPEVLGNPARVDELLAAMPGIVRVDEGLTNDRINDLLGSLRITGGRDVVSFQAPIVGFGWAGDQAIAEVDRVQLAELANALRADTVDDYLARFPDSCTGPDC